LRTYSVQKCKKIKVKLCAKKIVFLVIFCALYQYHPSISVV
jgi:hypothetical protein